MPKLLNIERRESNKSITKEESNQHKSKPNIMVYHSIQKPRSFEIRTTKSQQSSGGRSLNNQESVDRFSQNSSSVLRTLLQNTGTPIQQPTPVKNLSLNQFLLPNLRASDSSCELSKNQNLLSHIKMSDTSRQASSAGNSLTRQP